jgi:hypothetical protein
MTPEEKDRLQEKRWLNRAYFVRNRIRNVISSILKKNPEEIQFTDFALTTEVRTRFATELSSKVETIVPDRSAAIDLVMTQLGDINSLAFLIYDDCDESGMIQLAFQEALASIDDILRSQGEYFGIISHDGTFGACITAEEGIAPHYPRGVVLWRDGKKRVP